MTSIAEFTTPADELALGQLFQDLPDAVIEVERIVPTGNRLFPYFWVRGADAVRAERLLRRLDGVTSVVLVDELENRGLFRVSWSEATNGIVDALVASDVTVLSTIGSVHNWLLEIRGTPDVISAFHHQCTENGIQITLDRLSSLSSVGDATSFDLTPDQHEALTLAYNEGYFDHPREVSLDDLASRIGISRQAVAARLRRGHRNLLGATIVPQTRRRTVDRL